MEILLLLRVGFEPTTFGLEVQRAIHCANGAFKTNNLMFLSIITMN